MTLRHDVSLKSTYVLINFKPCSPAINLSKALMNDNYELFK